MSYFDFRDYIQFETTGTVKQICLPIPLKLPDAIAWANKMSLENQEEYKVVLSANKQTLQVIPASQVYYGEQVYITQVFTQHRQLTIF